MKAAIKRVPARTVIIYKGDPATHVFYVLSGKVKVSAPSRDGKEITFGILGAGEFLGEIGALDETEHSATVTALEPTEVAVLTRLEFLQFLEDEPGLAVSLLRAVCRRLRQASETAEDISFLTLPARLAKKLAALAERFGEPTPEGLRIGLHLCQQELANLVSTSRESINKQLSVWQAMELVRIDRGHLIIRDMSKLAAMTDRPVGQPPRSHW